MLSTQKEIVKQNKKKKHVWSVSKTVDTIIESLTFLTLAISVTKRTERAISSLKCDIYKREAAR